MSNGTVLSSSDERENLVHNVHRTNSGNIIHRSDSGGFKSHKPDSVAALNPAAGMNPGSNSGASGSAPAPAPHDFQDEPIYYNKRQSMIKSQECIQDMPDLPSGLPDPGLDAANGNTIYGYHSSFPLETNM